jgi:DNA gyrase subunit A
VTGFTFTASSSFPSFNLEEAFNAVIELIKDPDYDPILYPDLPTKCIIVDEGNFPDICRTGKGTFKMKADIEIDHENHSIIVHSLPYHTSISNVIDNIIKLKDAGNIPGITKIFDGSNRHGINITIICAPDINLEAIVDILYKKTPLMDTFSVQMSFVDNYMLKIFNLKQIMQRWISSRRLMKRKYATHRMVKLREECHVLDALINITSSETKSQQMIHDIRHSTDDEMVDKLCKRFKNLTSLQAKSLIEMRVKKFSSTNHDRYVKRLKENEDEIIELTDLIVHPEKIDKVIIDDLKEVIAKYAMPRRSKIEKFDPNKAEYIPDDDYILVFTKKGLVKKLNEKSKGIGKLNDGDEPIFTLKVSNRDSVVLFDRGGMIHTIKVNDILQTETKSVGVQIGKYINLNTGIVMCIPLSDIDPKDEFVFVTEKGNIKKTSCEKYGFKSSILSILLKNNDGLASVICARGNSDIIVFTRKGVGNRFNTNELKETSRMSSGVIAIDVADDDQVIGVATVSSKDKYLAMMTTKGNGKVCSLSSFDTGKRRDTALRLITCSANEEVIDIIPCSKKSKFIIAMKKEVVEASFNDFPELTRTHHGKKMVAVPNGEQIIRFMKV